MYGPGATSTFLTQELTLYLVGHLAHQIPCTYKQRRPGSNRETSDFPSERDNIQPGWAG